MLRAARQQPKAGGVEVLQGEALVAEGSDDDDSKRGGVLLGLNYGDDGSGEEAETSHAQAARARAATRAEQHPGP